MSRSPASSHEEFDNRPVKCQICGKEKTFAESMPAEMIRDSLVRLIRRDLPGRMPDGYICRDDLELYRGRLVSEELDVGIAEAGSIEAMVAKSIAEEELVSGNVNEEFDVRTTLGRRLADRMASFGGSWTFILIFFRNCARRKAGRDGRYPLSYSRQSCLPELRFLSWAKGKDCNLRPVSCAFP